LSKVKEEPKVEPPAEEPKEAAESKRGATPIENQKPYKTPEHPLSTTNEFPG